MRAPAPLIPPVLPRWPVILRVARHRYPAGYPDAALARIRAGTLFWPAVRARAARPRALALTPALRDAARAAFPDAEIAVGRDLSAVDPERLEAIFAPPAAPEILWAALGGIATPGVAAPDPQAALASAEGRSPWTGEALELADAVEAQALLRARAMAARGPLRLVGMTRWKRRCLAPFLTGPDGPPTAGRATDGKGGAVRWGAGTDEETEAYTFRVEDGFLRSVGLGLRHTPPLSLTIHAGPPHFDATRSNAFETTVSDALFTSDLLARAARLRAAIACLGVTKYNLGGVEPLPDAQGREAVLVPGQVATDASIRLGARSVRTDLALLEAARARFPDAFLLYKPHPDVATGLREGAAAPEAVARLADATVVRADMAACLAWCDRVATITSLTGFEALLRGRAATCFGRPFYAGWGLTDDADPPPRTRRLTLDELVAATLILHPVYVDPATRLPCPPEIAVATLARQRAEARRPTARAVRLWRDAASWALNRL
ncbi:MAG: beta-3-deoxy-D-manno-oct-2-ulosonic acid transferase [Rhodobacteraceae bacterium]|nr:MAG: beta-3-deoxy-D-manno-oct-2-ulosonic acid transferase [Paracoccaceae bacterium]